jgi:hypothetical protein
VVRLVRLVRSGGPGFVPFLFPRRRFPPSPGRWLTKATRNGEQYRWVGLARLFLRSTHFCNISGPIPDSVAQVSQETLQATSGSEPVGLRGQRAGRLRGQRHPPVRGRRSPTGRVRSSEVKFGPSACVLQGEGSRSVGRSARRACDLVDEGWWKLFTVSDGVCPPSPDAPASTESAAKTLPPLGTVASGPRTIPRVLGSGSSVNEGLQNSPWSPSTPGERS